MSTLCYVKGLRAQLKMLEAMAKEVAALLEEGALPLHARRKARPLLMQAYLVVESSSEQDVSDPQRLNKARFLCRELDALVAQVRSRGVELRTGMRLPWPLRVRTASERPTAFAAKSAHDFGGTVTRRAKWMIDRAEALAQAMGVKVVEPRESGPADRLDLELVTGEAEWD